MREASLVKGINIFGFEKLTEVISFFDGVTPYSSLEDESKKLLQMAFDRFKYSARTFHKFLKVARTFADMDGSENISKRHIAKALMCRDLDKEQVNMVVV
jgi:magnesium chelatase family protein